MAQAVRTVQVSLDEADGLVRVAIEVAKGEHGQALRILALLVLEERAENTALRRYVSRGYVRAGAEVRA